MKQQNLSKWLKTIIIGMALCGIIVYAVVIPTVGKSIVSSYPEFEDRFWPWLVFLWLTGIPCYAALYLGWQIADLIGKDRSFSAPNARNLKRISYLAAGDAALFFIGNVVLLLLSMSHPGVVLLSLLIVFAGIAIAVAAAALSHLVQKAVALQEQSDLTI